jgi:hypothetical protein
MVAIGPQTMLVRVGADSAGLGRVVCGGFGGGLPDDDLEALL